MNKAKILYGKMNDYKRYAFTLLALTAFLYLGVVIPMEGKTMFKTYILMGGTVTLLSLSTYFFYYSNQCRSLLNECEDGQEYLMKK